MSYKDMNGVNVNTEENVISQNGRVFYKENSKFYDVFFRKNTQNAMQIRLFSKEYFELRIINTKQQNSFH